MFKMLGFGPEARVGKLLNKGQIGDVEAIKDLANIVVRGYGDEYHVALNLDGIAEMYFDLLHDTDDKVKNLAVRVLNNLNRKKVYEAVGGIEGFARLLSDKDPVLRTFAVHLLYKEYIYKDPSNGQCSLLTRADKTIVYSKSINAGLRMACESPLLSDKTKENASHILWAMHDYSQMKAKEAEIESEDARIMALYSSRMGGKRTGGAASTMHSAKAPSASAGVMRSAVSERSAGGYASSAASGSFSIIPHRDLKFIKELGRGGFGIVSMAKWGSMDVAVKSLLMTDISDRSASEFKSEALIHAGLHHENVVALKGACLEPTKYALVMELLVKGSLYALLRNGQELPWSLRLSIAKDIVSGLVYLHSKGVLHRDLKSLNILLNDRLRAKLADFGLSGVKAETRSTLAAVSGSAGSVAGSVLWMAPELFGYGGECTELSDIYALGVVLWELASRELPFKSARSDALVIKWVAEEGRREAIPAGTPPKIASLIGRCWAARKEERPQSAKAVLSELSKDGAGTAVDSGYMAFSH